MVQLLSYVVENARSFAFFSSVFSNMHNRILFLSEWEYMMIKSTFPCPSFNGIDNLKIAFFKIFHVYFPIIQS